MGRTGTLSAVAVALLAGKDAMAQGMAGDTSKDVSILNVALGLEHEAINAYQLGAGSGLLQKPVLDVAVRFQADHKAHRDALIPLLEPLLRSRTTLAWVDALEAAGVPCGPINRLNEVFADPQVQHRGMRIDLPHPSAGSVPLVASPIRLSASPLEYAAPPPLLGQHTNEILQQLLGLPDEELGRLRDAGAIG